MHKNQIYKLVQTTQILNIKYITINITYCNVLPVASAGSDHWESDPTRFWFIDLKLIEQDLIFNKVLYGSIIIINSDQAELFISWVWPDLTFGSSRTTYSFIT